MNMDASVETLPPAPKKTRAWLIGCIVFVLAFDIAFFWQRTGGAYRSEFGAHPDEAAHYVTGLFVRDSLVMAARYVADGCQGSPIRVGKDFADTYYAHYPKVSLGIWPPVFYLVQSAWTLPLSPSRTSILFLMCALAAALAVLIFRALRDEYGIWPAALGAALLLSLPLVRGSYGMVMAETLSALLMFGAALVFGSFLDREKRGDALRFGILAALAILTKGTGLALALVAPLALLFTRKFHLLKRPALWGGVLIVAVVAGPWTWATRNLGKGGWIEPSPSWHFTREAVPYYATKFGLGLGVIALLLFCIGAMLKLRACPQNRGRWAAAGALILAVFIFQAVTPVGLEARHLIPILPAAVMFAIAGLAALAGMAKSRKGLASAVLGVAVLAASVWPLSQKGFSGFAPLAAALLEEAGPEEVTLVSSDARGEGMFISEVAMREQRPGHVIQRASKSLASSTWSGSGYAPLFADDDALLAFLTGGKIQYLLIDDALPEAKRREHHDQLKRLIELHPDRFWVAASSEIFRDGERQFTPAKLYKIQRRK